MALTAMLGLATTAGAQSWSVYGGDTGNTRFSEAKMVTTANVSKLKVEWALQLGTTRSQESTPILIGDTLYLTSSFGPKNVFAVNAKTGKELWKTAIVDYTQGSVITSPWRLTTRRRCTSCCKS